MGGSSECEFYVRDCDKQLEYPCILISNTCLKFDFAKSYENINLDGSNVSHNYSMDILPLNIEVAIKIYVNDISHEQIITEKIQELYSGGLQINVSDGVNENECVPLKVVVQSGDYETTTITSEDNKFVKEIIIPFCNTCIPYAVKEYDVEEIPKNRMLLVTMMKRKMFYEECIKKIEVALNELKWYYNDLVHSTAGFVKFKKKESIIDTAFHSAFSTLGHAVGDVFKSKDYKKLREDFIEKRPIDKTLFDSVMKYTTCIYPLYEKTMQGWSYEQLKEDLEKYQECIKERKEQVIQDIGLPDKFEKLPPSLGTPKSEIEFLSEYMLVNPKRTIKQAIVRREEQLYQKALEEQRELERRREENLARQEAGLEEPSSGPGFLSRTLSTATGVALGNKMSGGGHKEKKSYYSSGPRRDLMGSASCVYGKKDSHGIARSCPSCPVHRQCSRYHL